MGLALHLYSVSIVWPMGCGSSSFASQCLTLGAVTTAGFSDGKLVTGEVALVDPHLFAIPIAIDNVFCFGRV